MKFDFLFIGSGLFSCTMANILHDRGFRCLIIEKRDHPFGNCYTEKINNIEVHKYGPHIFHTSNDKIWNYVNQFTKFNSFINRPKINFNNELYSFPINLFTLYQLWGVKTPKEAIDKINTVKHNINSPSNLEEWILNQVGSEIYEKFIYGYTKKQWNTEPKKLPSFIIQRLPIRFNFNDNYFNDTYQGIPVDGYSKMMFNMTDGIEIILDTDYLIKRDYWNSKANTIVYTGPIDNYFNNTLGKLEYRSLQFKSEYLNISDFQGNAVINYTSDSVPYTRIVEHKHFHLNSEQAHTIITKEYPADYNQTNEPFYPINNAQNNNLFDQYSSLSKKNSKVIFGGRLASYKYYDMHQIIGSAMKKVDLLC